MENTTHLEYLAVVWVVLFLFSYLEGTRITVQKDHEPLKAKLNLADATCKLACWRLRLSEVEFDAVHRAVVKNQTADALWRFPTIGEDWFPIHDASPVMSVNSQPR